jgi:TonB family protein
MRFALIVTGLAVSLLVGAPIQAQPEKGSTSVSFAYLVDLVKFLTGDGKMVQVAAQGKTKAVIEKTDPVFNLPIFPVRALLLRLSPYHTPYTMTVTTYLGGLGRTKHILIPSGGQLFDAEFNPTRAVPETAFQSKAPGLTKGSRLEATIPFEDEQRTETLLLLYVNTRTAGNRIPIEWRGTDFVTPLLVRAERSAEGTIEIETNPTKPAQPFEGRAERPRQGQPPSQDPDKSPTSDIPPPLKIKDVAPLYPEGARLARVQGDVVAEATIGSDGKVQSARIIQSIPELDQAAVEAVRQWEYTPTVINGQAVPVIMIVTVSFRLQ